MTRVLVTGAGGFVGRKVLRGLQGRDLQVVALDAIRPATPDPGVDWVIGDFTEAGVRHQAIGTGVDAIVHLAALPGGAAEADPVKSRQVNIESTLALLEAAAALGSRPRVVFASTIAVYGEPLPATGVDDSSPPAPRLIYGAHKLMIEAMIATLTRRGAIDGISLRLPGIVARPRGASGMKSAFMSDLFHALRDRSDFVCPVSPLATLWLMSVSQCADNLLHALDVGAPRLPDDRALLLPALRVSMSALVAAVARQTGQAAERVRYQPDAGLEAAFGNYPPLRAARAEAAGFAADASADVLVANALEVIAAGA